MSSIAIMLGLWAVSSVAAWGLGYGQGRAATAGNEGMLEHENAILRATINGLHEDVEALASPIHHDDALRVLREVGPAAAAH